MTTKMFSTFTDICTLSSRHDYTVRQEGNITTVCVPMFTSVDPSDETGESSGVGFQLEAYENSIVFRARNCYDGKWLENYKYTFDIA